MKISNKLALSGLISSMSVAVMLLATIFPGGSLASSMVAGIILVIIALECKGKWAFSAFISTSFLSAFLVTDKESVIFFIVFFGHYPILKTRLDKIKNKILRIVLKISVFNICIVSASFLSFRFLGIPIENFEIFGIKAPYLLLLFSNIVFWMYESLIIKFIKVYTYKFQKRIL
ncbi:MAG: hypothetical protein LBF33_01430 [Oscillospiraceae bacterium]|jgi:hypothetical protein|nr:hypothetical protein [Oscillospiraceae bacterium]